MDASISQILEMKVINFRLHLFPSLSDDFPQGIMEPLHDKIKIRRGWYIHLTVKNQSQLKPLQERGLKMYLKKKRNVCVSPFPAHKTKPNILHYRR